MNTLRKIPTLTIGGHTYSNVELELDKYSHGGGVAITLFVTEDLYREPLAVATVNLDTQPSPGCVWIKDYSENEGMLEELTKAGIIEPTGRTCASGFVMIPEAKLLIGN